MSKNVICSKKCGICDGGKDAAKINNDYICNNCKTEYCSNTIRSLEIKKCQLCDGGIVVVNE